MRRREFIALLGGAVVAARPFAARAQQDLPVVGFANSGSAQAQALMLGAYPRGCRFYRGQERPDRVLLGRRSIRCGHFAPTQRICAETAVLVSLGPTLDRRPRLHPKE